MSIHCITEDGELLKKCSTCSLYKRYHEFYKCKSQATGFTCSCKTCHNVYYKKRRSATQKRDNLKSRWTTIKRKYGVTKEQYYDLLAKQKGRCAICNRTDAGHENGPDSLRIDHCHLTGKIRGLLCHSCNIGIGNLKDNSLLLRAAADYLDRTDDPNAKITKASSG